MGKSKIVSANNLILDIVGNAFGEFQSLRDEMGEWADNMSGANMEHLPKYDEVSEARDALENFCDNEPEVPAAFNEVRVDVMENHRKHQSRGDRLSYATQQLVSVVEWLESDEVTAGPNADDAETLRDELQNAIDEAESVSFPGMY